MKDLKPLAGQGLRDDEVELGSVVGVFGFRGEVRVHLHNPTSDLLAKAKKIVLIAPDGARYEATASTRPGAGQRILGKIAEVTTEEGARALRDYRLAVDKAALPTLEDDEYYVWQLQGAEVQIDGVPVGTVRAVQQTGPHDVLEIDRGSGDPAFVPVLHEFVERVDVEGSVIHLTAGSLDEP